MKSYARWIRRIYFFNIPSTLFTTLSIATSFFCVIFPIAFEYLISSTAPNWSNLENEYLLFVNIWAALCANYGVRRVFAFHPIANEGYRSWLSHTPWKQGKELPLGPLHPVWYDVITMLLIYGVMIITLEFLSPYYRLEDSWLIALIPLGSYLTGNAGSWLVANFATKESFVTYPIIIGIPIAIILLPNTIGLVLSLIAFAILNYIGVWKSLGRFPWENNTAIDTRLNQPLQQKDILGWPYRQILDSPLSGSRTSNLKALVIATIVLLWSLAINLLIKNAYLENGEKLSDDYDAIAYNFIIAVSLSMALALCRLIIDSCAIDKRLCFGNRVVHRKLFIFEHDQLLLTPLAIFLSGLLPTLCCVYHSMKYEDWESIEYAIYFVYALPVYLFLTLGRPLKESFFTGPQSLGPGMMTGAKQKQFAKLASPGD